MVTLLEVGESAGAECKAVLQEITTLVDRKLEEEGQQVKNLFGAAKINNNVDFLYLLADAAAAAFQYGFPDDLCSPLVDAKTNGKDLLFWFRCYGTVHNSGATSETTYHRPHWLVAFTMFSQSL
ncbi:hypothetical protein GW17_00031097 [Ensete ventricosum]|uniref:Uncharacterized protein n=1 Tax=Ensete ventricosum TaxID=4639 RepID=A0A426YHE4_ENSVE|nr:hypothetical protein B296_00030206 [Ensete ventricosum]RWW05618.1 hypothetical protein GW17_00031097 [Ensete ventricosum]RZS03619.1 hypothetical protein BHM03_00033812 [Ensete ventricosum]